MEGIKISRRDSVAQGSVRRRKRDVKGNNIVRVNCNPIIDTRTYEVEFEDGIMSTYSANVIAEIMYYQCDEEGQQYLLFGSILDHKTDGHALSVADQDVVLHRQISKRKTTEVWHLCVQWKDGTTTWERLLDLKKSHPIQVAEYSLERGISHEPDFNSWVTHVLKKLEAIISVLKGTASRVIKKNIKFGIRVPQTVIEEFRLNKNNGNRLWRYGI